MKKSLLTSLLALLVIAGTSLKAQDRANEYLGLPGDNLNLYAVMNLFQESETLEAFERSINQEDTRVNNLDLNGDNYVDYIMVKDFPDGNIHNIVLQVALSPKEKQDIAVFIVEKMRDGSVQIQLIGDESLYGRNYIVEPIYEETPNPGYTASGRSARAERTTYVHINAWPVVRYIYEPYYVTWSSSWSWGYYPSFWRPWEPCYYHYYYGYHYNFFPVYYRHYRHWHTPRWSHYHNHYYSHVRVYSPTVVVNINKGVYKKTYSRPETRKDGERLYASTRSSRSTGVNASGSRRVTSTSSGSGTARRTEASSSVSRSSEGTARRATGSSTVSRSSGSSREAVSTSRSSGTRSGSSQAGNPRSVTRNTEAGSAVSRSNGSTVNRSSEARPSTTQRSTSARPSAPVQSRSSEARSSSPGQRSSSARPSAPAQSRSSEARSSAPAQRSSSARPSAPAQSRSSQARSSAPAQRSSAARSSSSSRQSSSSAPSRASRSSDGGSKPSANKSSDSGRR